MRKAASITAWSVFGLIIAGFIAFFAPFIGFGGKDYHAVCADAAAIYGLDIDDYEIKIQKTVTNSKGQNVQGLFRVQHSKQTILIQENWSRPMVIATIFHEFAHAAQYKHDLDMGDLNCEQHAEVLSFYMMWNNNYKWNARHLMTAHMVGKPPEYRAPNELARIMLANHTSVSVDIPRANG